MPLRLALLAALLLPPAAARAEGMPQLDFANPLTTSQVVWGAIIFALLYVLLSRIGLPKVGAVLEERARHIAADLETAQAVEGPRRTRRRRRWPRRRRGRGPRRRPRSTRRWMRRSRRPRRGSRR